MDATTLRLELVQRQVDDGQKCAICGKPLPLNKPQRFVRGINWAACPGCYEQAVQDVDEARAELAAARAAGVPEARS